MKINPQEDWEAKFDAVQNGHLLLSAASISLRVGVEPILTACPRDWDLGSP